MRAAALRACMVAAGLVLAGGLLLLLTGGWPSRRRSVSSVRPISVSDRRNTVRPAPPRHVLMPAPLLVAPAAPAAPAAPVWASPPAAPIPGAPLFQQPLPAAPPPAAAPPQRVIAAPAWDTPQAPAPSVTAAPPPAAAPFGSPTAVPPPGFVESPSVQRNPVVVLGNLEGETFTLTLQGPVQYRVVVAPYSHRQFQVLPGTYAVSLECETALPNSGWGIFREYCRYTATACKEASSRAEPLRMGDLAQ